MFRSIIIAGIMVVAFGISQQALAKKVNNNTASSLLTQCMLADDTKTALGSSEPQKVACCSRSLGYCVTCETSGAGRCNKTAYSSRPASLLRDEAPASGAVSGGMAPTQPSSRTGVPRSRAPAARSNAAQ